MLTATRVQVESGHSDGTHPSLPSSLPPRLPPIYSSVSSLAHLTLGWEHSPPDGVQEEGHHRDPLSLYATMCPTRPSSLSSPV